MPVHHRFTMTTRTYNFRANCGHPTACRKCGAECRVGDVVVTRIKPQKAARSHLYCEPCAVRLMIIEEAAEAVAQK